MRTQTQTSKDLHRRKILTTTQEAMPSVEVLKQIVPYAARPACTHHLNKPLPNGKYQCTSRASYKINGQLVCERHAGRELLIAHLRRIGFNHKPGDKLG